MVWRCYKSDGNVYLIKASQCKISIFTENHSQLILSQAVWIFGIFLSIENLIDKEL